MAILIKGMEMPKKCQYCPISHWNTLDIITGCELVDRYVSKTDKRLEDHCLFADRWDRYDKSKRPWRHSIEIEEEKRAEECE